MPVTFDTHRLITRLTQGEMTLAQAEAVSDALQQALEGSIGQLATKEDLAQFQAETRHEFAHVRTDMKHLKWMIGVNWALMLLVLGKLLLFKP